MHDFNPAALDICEQSLPGERLMDFAQRCRKLAACEKHPGLKSDLLARAAAYESHARGGRRCGV
jgi:hypothetical protein